MRSALLAFALGIIALQQQAALPPLPQGAGIVALVAMAIAAAWLERRSVGWRRRAAQIAALFTIAAAAGSAGFFYAAWRADLRLADELPSAWEGRDVRVVGVIDELPQPVERGVRFAFAVERVLTPEAIVPSQISLAWYAAFSRDAQTAAVPELHASERWEFTVRLKRPHGTVNPHGFDVEAWLLEISLMQTVPVGWVASSLPPGHPILRVREEHGETTRRCLAGDRWNWDGVDFQMLHPVAANYVNSKLKSNDLSCVLRVWNAAGSALLTGDIEARTEADLLVVPHHGSRTSSTPAFIDAVHPRVAAFTPGYRNRFQHPRPEVVQRYIAASAGIYRTDYDGALTFDFGEGGPQARREREHDVHYWRELPRRGDLPPVE